MDTLDSLAEEAFKVWGQEALTEHARRRLQEWRCTEVNMAVIGQVGVGKASFINTLRGIEDLHHPLSACVGEEANQASSCFAFPSNPLVKVWKVPGVGQGSSPRLLVEQWAKRVELARFDVFILLTCDRFGKVDKEVTELVKLQGKPFYLARTKTEDVLEQQDSRYNFDTMAREIRAECLNQLWPPQPQVPPPHVYLITTKPLTDLGLNFHDNENEELNEHIVNSVPEHKRTAIGKMSFQYPNVKLSKFRNCTIAPSVVMVSTR